jgi:hypothetical protein
VTISESSSLLLLKGDGNLCRMEGLFYLKYVLSIGASYNGASFIEGDFGIGDIGSKFILLPAVSILPNREIKSNLLVRLQSSFGLDTI